MNNKTLQPATTPPIPTGIETAAKPPLKVGDLLVMYDSRGEQARIRVTSVEDGAKVIWAGQQSWAPTYIPGIYYAVEHRPGIAAPIPRVYVTLAAAYDQLKGADQARADIRRALDSDDAALAMHLAECLHTYRAQKSAP